MLSLKCRNVAILIFFWGGGSHLVQITLRDWPWVSHLTCQVARMCITVHVLTPSHVAPLLQVSSTFQRQCAEDPAVNTQVSGGCLSKWSRMGMRAIARTRRPYTCATHTFIYFVFFPVPPFLCKTKITLWPRLKWNSVYPTQAGNS